MHRRAGGKRDTPRAEGSMHRGAPCREWSEKPELRCGRDQRVGLVSAVGSRSPLSPDVRPHQRRRT